VLHVGGGARGGGRGLERADGGRRMLREEGWGGAVVHAVMRERA
jgi:hypothetical protein